MATRVDPGLMYELKEYGQKTSKNVLTAATAQRSAP